MNGQQPLSMKEAQSLRSRCVSAEVERSSANLAARHAIRTAIDATNTLHWLQTRVIGFLRVAPGPGRDTAESELIADMNKGVRQAMIAPGPTSETLDTLRRELASYVAQSDPVPGPALIRAIEAVCGDD